MRTKHVFAGTLAIAFALSDICTPRDALGQILNESLKLLPADGAAGDEFGRAVSLSGDVAVVAASKKNDEKRTDAGFVYVFRRSGPLWVQEQRLVAADGGEGDEFGHSVSVSGDLAVVGAELNDDLETDAGSAYVFRWDGGSWVREQKLLAADAAENDRFGSSVSVFGDVAVVGAYFDDDNAPNAGSAYVFRFNAPGFASTWSQEQELFASDGTPLDFFGHAVSVSGDVVVAGAPDAENVDDDKTGAAYVFRWDGSSWIEEQKLLALDGADGDNFGNSVSISGEVIVVGANFEDASGSSSGSAYVFRWNGSSWVQEQKLLASDGTGGDGFGFSVSVSGDVALVGAFGHGDNGPFSGSAYVFRWNGTLWIEEQKLLASDGAASDIFGRFVSVGGSVALIGAPGDGDQGALSGSAYVFLGLCEKDTDADTVCDSDDVCPGTPEGVPVDSTGRPVGDLDGECDTDIADFQRFQEQFEGDLAAFQLFLQGFSGPREP